MKQLMWVLLGFFHITLSSYVSTAQDLSQLIPAAHYTLINTSVDILGLQDTILLINSPYGGDQGVYCNGNYINHPGDSSLVITPDLDPLFDSVFALQLEFRIADLDQLWRPAFVCGRSYRYLGLLTGADSSFYALINNSFSYKIETIKVQVDHWYEVTMIHHTPDSLTEFYLDGEKVFELHIPIIRNDSDGDISNTNFSSGLTFKGYWRNLRVYGSENISPVRDLYFSNEGIKVYPNPSAAVIHVDAAEIKVFQWVISDLCGRNLLSGDMMALEDELDIQFLSPGVYVLQLMDVNGMPLAYKKFVKE